MLQDKTSALKRQQKQNQTKEIISIWIGFEEESILPADRKNNMKIETKYVQIIHLAKDCYVECKKDSARNLNTENFKI